MIFRIPNLKRPMKVSGNIPELFIGQIRPGLPVRIKVDAFPHQSFAGKVLTVAPLPRPGISGPQGGVYTTWGGIDNGPSGLRPGMRAEFEILVNQLDNVLSVPVTAIVHVRAEGKDRVSVKNPDGSVTWRDVTLGLSNSTRVEVKSGLSRAATSSF
jgi:multidrug efflux pump subunit AcrA (membrane-fusion protein)